MKKYWFILLIWLLGLFLRCYRQSALLGFYYDQGRDAKIVADIISGRNLPAIGPTTGIEGLYLGPFWYYLLTPAYFLGQGSPIVAACFIAFLESLTIPVIYLTLKKYHPSSALSTSLLWSLSYYLIRSARWFSNPSPLPLVVALMIYFLSELVIDKKTNRFPYLFLLLGIALQLEAASAVFFIPVLLLIFLFNSSVVKSLRFSHYLRAVGLFLLLLVPQIAFEIKNKFLITHNFFSFITGKLNTTTSQSWALPTREFALTRLHDYYEIFFSKLDTNTTPIAVIFLFILVVGLSYLLLVRRSDRFLQIILIWLLLPLVLLLFFIGNYGRLYDYYLTGLFVPFFFLFGWCLSLLPSLLILLPLLLFFQGNLVFIKNYLIAGVDGPTHITLGNQLQSLNYICQTAANSPYSLDVYVPPVDPHAYDYLLSWLASRKLCHLPHPSRQPNQPHFSLAEVDLVNPQRLNSWLDQQNSFAKVKNEVHFGGIVVYEK